MYVIIVSKHSIPMLTGDVTDPKTGAENVKDSPGTQHKARMLSKRASF